MNRTGRRIRALIMLFPLAAVLLLSRTAFAKTTYVITDGDRVFTYESYATDPTVVLTEAGLSLSENDIVTTESGFVTTALTVRRHQRITICYRGTEVTAESSGETVSSLLARLNLYPQEGDQVNVSLNSRTYDGMTIVMDQILRQDEISAAAIPHGVCYLDDPTLPEGTEEIMEPGRDGEMLRTTRVTYVNGKETHRYLLSETLSREPEDAIIARGTGTATAEGTVIGDGFITLPTGEVLTYTHTAQVRATAYSHLDEGCDMITATGTTVRIGTVAVDPRYIPYGTRMFIVSNDGVYEYGISVAEDCGGAIKGDRVDLYFPTYEACMNFGRRNCTIYFLG